MSFIVVRARSNVGVERSIRETMSYLNLTKVNHAVIIPENDQYLGCLLYTSPSPRDATLSRMPSSA